jgi:hypothetical protein
MDLKVFERMDEAELRRYLEFLLWHYRVVDGFWFLLTEKAYDRPTAERINEQVWEKASELGGRRIAKDFPLPGEGLARFARALELWPWSILVGYEIDQTPRGLFLSVPHCPPQEARIKRGLGEYDCREMHRLEFERFAQEIDPSVRVECIFAPPEPHPENLFCRWRFTLEV